jgi:hypothetical protein
LERRPAITIYFSFVGFVVCVASVAPNGNWRPPMTFCFGIRSSRRINLSFLRLRLGFADSPAGAFSSFLGTLTWVFCVVRDGISCASHWWDAAELKLFPRIFPDVDAALVANWWVNYWKIIADNLTKAGWNWGCVSTIDCDGGTIWIADAHRGGKLFLVQHRWKAGGIYGIRACDCQGLKEPRTDIRTRRRQVRSKWSKNYRPIRNRYERRLFPTEQSEASKMSLAMATDFIWNGERVVRVRIPVPASDCKTSGKFATL